MARSVTSAQIDCANGVGANSAKSFAAVVGKAIQFELFNDGSSGELNKNVREIIKWAYQLTDLQCGADFVKVQQVNIISIDIIILTTARNSRAG